MYLAQAKYYLRLYKTASGEEKKTKLLQIT